MNSPINTKELNEKIKTLKEQLKKEESFKLGIESFLKLHTLFYPSSMGQSESETYEDLLWKDLDEEICRTSLNSKGRTIPYGIWHVTRIEDLTMNILVDGGEQVYNRDRYSERIKAGINHTGNSLNQSKILKMSQQIDLDILKEYRVEVGRQTQSIIKNLTFPDLKKRVQKKDIERILNEGGVDDVPEANWLLDFWAKKDTYGILFMPACRHQIVHLNECFRCRK